MGLDGNVKFVCDMVWFIGACPMLRNLDAIHDKDADVIFCTDLDAEKQGGEL